MFQLSPYERPLSLSAAAASDETNVSVQQPLKQVALVAAGYWEYRRPLTITKDTYTPDAMSMNVPTFLLLTTSNWTFSRSASGTNIFFSIW